MLNKRRKSILLFLVFLGAITFISQPSLCFSKSRKPTLVISPGSAIVELNRTVRLRVLYDPDGPGGPERNRDVSYYSAWDTADVSIASVNSYGRVKGESGGKTTIFARYNDLTASAKVLVKSFLIINKEKKVIYSQEREKITISGRVFRGDTNEGLSGVTVYLCGAGTAVTDANGYWSKEVSKGDVFCVGLGSIPYPNYYNYYALYNRCTSYAKVYLWQVAGEDKFISCSYSDERGNDLSFDNRFDFRVDFKKISPTPRPTPVCPSYPCPAPANKVILSGRVIDAAKGEGVEGIRLDLGSLGEAITDKNGYWSKEAKIGEEFYVRVKSSNFSSGFFPSIKAINNNACHKDSSSYEHQIAGRNAFISCSNLSSPSSWDLANDNSYDFVLEYPLAKEVCPSPAPANSLLAKLSSFFGISQANLFTLVFSLFVLTLIFLFWYLFIIRRRESV